MVEAGIMALLAANAGVTAIAPHGGYYQQLPADAPLPSYSYRLISNVITYALRGETGFTKIRLQIDCYGRSENRADALILAKAINAVLSGYSGTLADADATQVFGCFRSDVQDFYDDTSRSYRRMIEFEIDLFAN